MTRAEQGLVRERVEIHPRKRLTGNQAVFLRQRQDYLCGCGCGESLFEMLDTKSGPGTWRGLAPWIDEHVVPLELGGSNDLNNRAIYLVDCAKAKTREDIKRIRKAQRLERDSNKETRRRSPRPMRSRGFQKDPLR